MSMNELRINRGFGADAPNPRQPSPDTSTSGLPARGCFQLFAASMILATSSAVGFSVAALKP